ncbi:MAG: dihydroxy-acid dehydratase [Planctomycetaceae bacterium]
MQLESHIAASPGHCIIEGTASTMTSIAETMGMAPPGSASVPATHSGHSRIASAISRQA